jgi:hypothetical protein
MSPLRSISNLTVLSAVLFGAVASATANNKAGFHWDNDEEAGTADLLFGDQPVIRYMYAYDTSHETRAHETYKVFHHVYGPGSKTIITKGPHGKYTHHRGLYIGWNKTGFEGTSLDFWHCTKGAHLRHVKFVDLSANEDHGSMTAEIHWNDAEGKPVIVEWRTVSVSNEPASEGWHIDWSTKLESRRGDITLDGDRQHAGFQFRADQPVADSNGGTYLRPETFPQGEAAIQVGDKGNPPAHINLGWFALSYELKGQRYTVEYFDNPNLPKPSLFSERPYGRFGTFFKKTLKADTPLEMKYRVIVGRGKPSVDDVQSRYDAFLNALK